MTVEQLIEELKALPQTAIVFVESNDDDDDLLMCSIIEVIYEHGNVAIRFEV